MKAPVDRPGVFDRVQPPVDGPSRQSLLREHEQYDRSDGYNRYDRHNHGKGSRGNNLSPRKYHEQGFMKDARVSHRHGAFNDSFPRNNGGKVGRYNSKSSHHTSRYDPYKRQKPHQWRAKEKLKIRTDLEEVGWEAYVHERHSKHIKGASNSGIAETSEHKQCSGKRISSVVVSPARNSDANVTKRERSVVRLLTFSPKEKEQQPPDAQIIGALNDMEIAEASNMEVEDQEVLMQAEDHDDDDLLGDKLMEIEEDVTKGAVTGEEIADRPMMDKSRATSSRRRGRRPNITLGLPNKKAEFFRRGSPKLRRSSSREAHHSERRSEQKRNHVSRTRKSNGLEGSKNASRRYP